MKESPKVYVETTVVSYLTARPSRDLLVAAHQQVTAEWWATERNRFEVVVSQLVVEEAAGGDPDAAARRMAVLAGLQTLGLTMQALELAERLVEGISLVPSENRGKWSTEVP